MNHPSTSQKQSDSLLVFGYSCRVFRDDSTASTHNEGAHLRPWPVDADVLLDRYDVRLLLHSSNSLEKQQLEECSIDAAEDQICDLERYEDLQKSLEDEEESEEARKRSRGGAAVAFSYEENGNDQAGDATPPEVDDIPYVPPKEIEFPVGVDLPPTARQHAIIEKTALFVSKAGQQMEILIKAKQSKNRSFDFLNIDDILNPFYRYTVKLIRENNYTPHAAVEEEAAEKTESEEDDSDDDGHYLHPSLLSAAKTAPARDSPQPPSNYRIGTGDDVYSQLYNRILASDARLQQAQQKDIEQTVHQYSSGHVAVPGAQEQAVIERMAQYVSRNGPDFERAMQERNDSRFTFLFPNTPFHTYYQCRLRYYQHVLAQQAALRPPPPQQPPPRRRRMDQQDPSATATPPPPPPPPAVVIASRPTAPTEAIPTRPAPMPAAPITFTLKKCPTAPALSKSAYSSEAENGATEAKKPKLDEEDVKKKAGESKQKERKAKAMEFLNKLQKNRQQQQETTNS